MMDQDYAREDDPGSFIREGWEEEALGVEAFQEPPGSFTDHAGDNSYRVPLTSQEQAYANHGSQVDQVTTADGGPSSTAPFHQEERTGGRREGARSKAPPQGTRNQGTPGGRPSAGVASTTLPPAEDPWSPREPLASPFPLLRRPGDRSAQRRSRVAQGGVLDWRYEARSVPVKKARCL